MNPEEIHAIVQAEVHAEMTRFMEHMRVTALDGREIVEWIRSGLLWYLTGEGNPYYSD